jgi:hypothetical protein
MGKGDPKTVTTTTNSEPPEYLQAPLRFASRQLMSNFGNQDLQDNVFGSLDQQFNRASDLTQNRLSSEFAGAGRNLGASAPARSEELQTLASNIYDPSNLYRYDPTNMLIDRLSSLIPNAGGTTTGQQPYFKRGLF